MSTILVTGVAGFIGSHVAEKLLERGDTVVGLDNVNDYYSVALKENNISLLGKYKNFSMVRGDLVDTFLLAEIFSHFEFTHVAHLAARAGVRPSIQNAGLYADANFRGTLNLLEEARKAKSLKNFVLTSSSSVYGNSKKVPFREDDSATDRPISQYAATKKATEVLGYTYHHLYGLNVNVVRPFTVYGPRGRPDMAAWLFVEAAVKGTPINRYGDGSTRRDYTYIDDFVAGFVNALDRPFGYEIFNLGNSHTVPLSEALAIVAKVTGKNLNIKELPMQPGDVDLTNADVSKAAEKLSYKPEVSFADGMQKFFNWYQQAFLK